MRAKTARDLTEEIRRSPRFFKAISNLQSRTVPSRTQSVSCVFVPPAAGYEQCILRSMAGSMPGVPALELAPVNQCSSAPLRCLSRSPQFSSGMALIC